MSYRAVKNERVSSDTKNQCHPEQCDNQALTSIHHWLHITFDRSDGSILGFISLAKLCLLFFAGSFIAQVDVVVFASLSQCSLLVNRSIKVIVENVIRNWFVLEKFHASSTWLFSFVFFHYRYIWEFLNTHYPIQQCVVAFWTQNNVWSFKSVSIAIFWKKASSIFFWFRLQV